MRARLRKVLIPLLVVVVSVVATLVVLEICLRVFRPQHNFAVTVNTWDQNLGTRHIPGAKGFVKSRAYEMDLIINSKGLRDREFTYAKAEHTKRVLCLGGSFTCGYGVQAEDTFAKVLERLLNDDADESVAWEVLNGGVGSTGTAHQLAFFMAEGHKYNPDYVLLCFSQQTDYWDNKVSGLYTIEDDKLVKHDAPRTSSRRIQDYVRWIPGYNTIFARSHLLNFIKIRVARHHYRDLADRIVAPDPERESSKKKQEEELTRRLLMGLRDACYASDCRLVMTGIPLPDTWGWNDQTVELIDFLAEEEIPFINLGPALRRGAEEGHRIHYEADLHWTIDGHRLVGEALYDFFVSQDGPSEASPRAHSLPF